MTLRTHVPIAGALLLSVCAPLAAQSSLPIQAKARVVTDAELDDGRLAGVLEELLGNPEALRSMGGRARELGKPEATRDIVAIARDLMNRGGAGVS